MEKKGYFAEKKDLFVTNLVESYLKTKVFFDSFFKQYKEQGKIEFALMDQWVGNEMEKGPLWILKDECHTLFRKGKNPGVCEYLFDWTIGSIFHESMKLKEDVYQKEAYGQSYEKFEPLKNHPQELQEILEEYHLIMDKIDERIAEEMERTVFLFSKATKHLKPLLRSFVKNGLLCRFLIENEDKVEKVFGKNGLEELFKIMYPREWEKGFLVGANNYLEGGWYSDAIKTFKKVLAINPKNQEAQEGIKVAKRKLSSLSSS